MTTTAHGITTKVAGQEFGVYQLARLADCSDPDSADSAGAKFLFSLASATDELADRLREDEVPEDRWDYSGQVHEVADGGPDIYTHTMWSEFVDLCAYHEDPTDLGFDGSDMQQGARICLFIIAERLVWALLREVGPFDGSEDEEEDDA